MSNRLFKGCKLQAGWHPFKPGISQFTGQWMLPLTDATNAPRAVDDMCRTRNTPGLVELESDVDVLRLLQTLGQHQRVLQCLAGSLPQIWRHRVRGIPEQGNTPARPVQKRRAIVN